jgi:hypothetical protein
MVEFDLDLQAVEDHLAEAEGDGGAVSPDADGRVVLARLDGTTPPEEWLDAIEAGDILVLAVEGDLNELAAPFAREVRDAGGHLVTFRDFLLVSPPERPVDSSRLE